MVGPDYTVTTGCKLTFVEDVIEVGADLTGNFGVGITAHIGLPENGSIDECPLEPPGTFTEA